MAFHQGERDAPNTRTSIHQGERDAPIRRSDTLGRPDFEA